MGLELRRENTQNGTAMRMELVRCGFGASEMVRIGEFLVLGRRIGTDKRPCGYLEDWPLGFWVNEPTPAVALVLRPMRRNGSVRCGMGAQVCVFDTYRGPRFERTTTLEERRAQRTICRPSLATVNLG